ncbi:BatD family protein [Vibrio sp. MMG022]|uniref:BatD family protein n=1 Tax=Vibrio TaxID=662 RepID=UPI001F2B794D|nr:BatD family protein [Vibrio sp. MMG023]MCF6450680.1 BatD family protein [Vibrio sp. MMG023]CAH1607461.1 BatD [Vibrio jasicida]
MMKKGAKLVFVLMASLLTSFSVFAQSLQASVNKTQVAKNEVINLRIMADTELGSDAIDFDALKQDFFLGQPRYGRSSNNINGHKTVRTEWSISIAPMKEGVVTIPSFSADGMKTEPIKLRVTKDKGEPNLDDLFSFNMSVDSHTLYPQQSATLRMQLAIKVDPRRLDNPQVVPPSIDGMKIEPASDMKQAQRIIDGLEVTVVEQAFRITAEQPGTYTLNGPKLTGSYIYGDSLTGSTKIMPINTKTEQMPITVKPIPKDFKGNWLPASALELTQSWQDEQGNPLSANAVSTVKQGSSITRTIRIRASGTQAEYLPRIGIVYPSTLRVYPEQPQFETARDGTVTMTMKQVLIPTEAGDLTLPGYKLNWWDSNRDQARESKIAELNLKVEKSDTGLITLPESVLPTQPTQTASPTAPQGGVDTIWQTLTFVFAVLWLVSSAIAIGLWRKRKTPQSTEVMVSTHNASIRDIEDVIKQGDSIKIEKAVNDYLNTHYADIESEAVQAVRTELNVMNQSRFSSTQQPWKSDTLLAILKQLSKDKTTKTSHQLEKL